MIVISDADGTLISPTVPESSACLSLFELLRANRVSYILATSRPWVSLVEVLPRTVQNARYCVCADGAITLKPTVDGPVVIARSVLSSSDEMVSRILKARPPGSSLYIFLDDRSEFLVAGDINISHMRHSASILGSRRFIPLSKLVGHEGILSIGILGSHKQCSTLMTLLKRDNIVSRKGAVRVYPEVRISSTSLYWCDVTSSLADKRLAVVSLLADGKLGSSEEIRPVIVLGDGDNDARMARLADLAFCPPWANPAMKHIAHEIECKDVQEFLKVIRIRIRTELGV